MLLISFSFNYCFIRKVLLRIKSWIKNPSLTWMMIKSIHLIQQIKIYHKLSNWDNILNKNYQLKIFQKF
jgi:hypothetical protein